MAAITMFVLILCNMVLSPYGVPYPSFDWKTKTFSKKKLGFHDFEIPVATVICRNKTPLTNDFVKMARMAKKGSHSEVFKRFVILLDSEKACPRFLENLERL